MSERRVVGSTEEGAPTVGSWTVGDFVLDADGTLWKCSVAGSPGTWVEYPQSAAYAPLAGAKLWLPANRFTGSLVGSPTLGTTGGGGRFVVWQLDAALFEQVNAVTELPVGWLTYAVDLYWSNSGAGAGDVSWTITRLARAAGDDMAVGDVAVTTVLTAPLASVLTVTEFVPTVTIDPAKPLTGIRVARDGTAGGDTLANDAAFVGLMLRRLT